MEAVGHAGHPGVDFCLLDHGIAHDLSRPTDGRLGSVNCPLEIQREDGIDNDFELLCSTGAGDSPDVAFRWTAPAHGTCACVRND